MTLQQLAKKYSFFLEENNFVRIEDESFEELFQDTLLGNGSNWLEIRAYGEQVELIFISDDCNNNLIMHTDYSCYYNNVFETKIFETEHFEEIVSIIKSNAKIIDNITKERG